MIELLLDQSRDVTATGIEGEISTKINSPIIGLC